MPTSIFLAKLIGPMLIIMGLSIMASPKRIQRMAEEFLASDALIFLSGVITLPVGLAIVNTHNVWRMEWPVIITIFGWITVLAGVVRMISPGIVQTIGRAMLGRPAHFILPGATMVLIGVFLAYRGYLGTG